MLTAAVIVFAVAAVGGVVLALHVLKGKLAPWALSVLHAGLGAAGIVLLLLLLADGGASLLAWALALFVVAALGGFWLASRHAKKELPPKGVVVLHAVLAVGGFALLLAAFLGAGAGA
ncbi:MAG TPA: hypothetical protein VKZ85_17335 [Woeseiaceae bacterium]|nr:hypothetical protein [Woeseiaceae bacterium]